MASSVHALPIHETVMYKVIFLSILSNAFFLWLLFYSHRKGDRHILGVGLFFLVISLVILVALYVSNYHVGVPAGMKEQVFEDYNEKIEWLLAIFGFVPAVFTGNMISKGLDGVYCRGRGQPSPVHGATQAPQGQASPDTGTKAASEAGKQEVGDPAVRELEEAEPGILEQGTREQEVPGQDVPGEDVPGEDVPGEDVPEQDAPGQDAREPGRQAPP